MTRTIKHVPCKDVAAIARLTEKAARANGGKTVIIKWFLEWPDNDDYFNADNINYRVIEAIKAQRVLTGKVVKSITSSIEVTGQAETIMNLPDIMSNIHPSVKVYIV